MGLGRRGNAAELELKAAFTAALTAKWQFSDGEAGEVADSLLNAVAEDSEESILYIVNRELARGELRRVSAALTAGFIELRNHPRAIDPNKAVRQAARRNAYHREYYHRVLKRKRANKEGS
jgi:hypothetical protein